MAIKSKRSFHAASIIAEARSGTLKGAALKKAIETAEEFGNSVAAEELRSILASAPAGGTRKRAVKG